ncbi:hypothetical protein CGRAC_1215 [Campylobacter gracilis]|nr:hypothetical protein CGRAC_1215 [Campylobacter gracilis]
MHRDMLLQISRRNTNLRLVFRRHAATRFCKRLVCGGAVGAARIKYTAVAYERNARLNFTRSLLRKHLHALRIYTRRGARIRDAKNEAVCARDAKYRGAKYRGAGSGRAVHETSRKAKRLLGLRSRRPSKIGFFKISPARRSQKSAFNFFSPAQILKSAL